MKILQSGDLHLGFKQYGFAERRDDFKAAAGFVFDEAARLQVDILLLTGDLFQNAKPSDEEVLFLQERVAQTKAKGIKVVGIDGNHDSTESGWLKVCGIEPLDKWSKRDLEGNRLPITTAMASHELHTSVNIFGLDGGSPTTIRAKLDELEKSEARFDILVLHTEVTEMCGFASSGFAASEIVYKLRNSGCRLVCMGHIHDYTEADFGGIRFIYAGSTEMWSRDEKTYKSFSLIEMDKDTLRTAYLPIPIRPQLDTYLACQEDLDKLLSAIDAAAGQGHQPMVLARYDPELPDFKKKLASLLDGRALYIPIPQSKSSAENGDPLARLAKDAFDRKGAMRGMADVLAQAFGSDSDATSLILKMLENPNAVQEIVLHYAKEKGLNIR